MIGQKKRLTTSAARRKHSVIAAIFDCCTWICRIREKLVVYPSQTPRVLLNMLKGEMSLIGPRPDPPDWLDRYPPEVRIFLQVRPGLTGYSQAFYRNSVDGNEKMKHDAYYAKHCTFLMDLKIFLKSIVVVLGHENTYKDMSQNQMDETEKEKLKILEKI